jgi:hypothetical protein
MSATKVAVFSSLVLAMGLVNSSLAWDPANPVDFAERQNWLALNWNENRTPAQQADLDAFSFTNAMPDFAPTMLANELAVFTDLYSDRLQVSAANGYYGILDLLNDDAEIRAKFQVFAMTGQFVTDANDGETLLIKHVQMIADAISNQQKFVLDGFDVVDGAVLSQKLRSQQQPANPTVPPTPVTPPALEQFECDLKYWIDQSRLGCGLGHSDRPALYEGENTNINNPTAQPRFDCDDFTDALNYFLQRRLKKIYPDAEIGGFGYFWYCTVIDPATGQPVIGPDGKPKRKIAGHAITYVLKDGKYWLVDPQNGVLRGPYDNLKDCYDDAFKSYSSCKCENGETCKSEPYPTNPAPYNPGDPAVPNPFIYKPGIRLPAEPQKPGLEYQEIQERLCKFLQWACAHCNTIAPPNQCVPSGLPADVNPDPCDSVRPYTKPGTFIPTSNPCYRQ